MSPQFAAVSDADRAAITVMLRALQDPLPAELAILVMPVAPIALERSRSTIRSGRDRHTGAVRQFVKHYTPARSRQAEAELSDVFAQVSPRPLCYTNIGLALLFYRPDRRAIDKDNLEKLVADAGTKAMVWQDDRQITAGIQRIELDAANPRTVIGFCRITSTLDRTIPQHKRRAPGAPLHQVFLAGR